jgi:uncharacterized protein
MDMVHALLELQEHDLALQRFDKELDEMPEKRSILTARAKLAEVEKLRTRSAAALHAIDQASRAIEDQIAALTAKMEAEQEKLVSGAIANPKELQAVSRELDSLRRRVDGLESDLLAQMQKSETAEAQVAKIDAALTEGRRREAQLTARFKERGAEILGHIEAEKRGRTVAASSIGPALLERYETSRARPHGIAVGVLHENMCSACRVGLPAGKVAALNAGPDIGACPSCGRMLIVRGV